MDQPEFSQKVVALLKSINCKLFSNLAKRYEPLGLTPQQASILLVIEKNKEVKVSELGCILNTPDSNISAICSRLEERDLIKRVRDENDRRVVKIKATTKSKKLFEEIKEEQQKMLAKMSYLDESDMVLIISALQKLDEIVDNKLNRNEGSR